MDFYCAERKLVIELDGSQHLEQKEYDKVRTDYLKSAGLRVIRFSNKEIRNNLKGVWNGIEEGLRI